MESTNIKIIDTFLDCFTRKMEAEIFSEALTIFPL
jgi:hypothetical protein